VNVLARDGRWIFIEHSQRTAATAFNPIENFIERAEGIMAHGQRVRVQVQCGAVEFKLSEFFRFSSHPFERHVG
jgi:hypothetical protein